jgi:cyclopropane fatty-acyl-phospholipid synthase-like methyltransferase
MSDNSNFWNALAPIHATIEDTNFNLASLRLLLPEIKSPVLVVGAGHGLIVGELQTLGYTCDGLDLSPEMVRQAELRRGIKLIQGDARAMPFPAANYETIIFATGVIDFTGNEEHIRAMLAEGRRVVTKSGKIFVAFYKAGAAQVEFMTKLGLLRNGRFAMRKTFETYHLSPWQMVDWAAQTAGISRWSAMVALFRMAAGSNWADLRITLRMQKIIQNMEDPSLFFNAVPESIPYRNQQAIEELFMRLAVPIKRMNSFPSCWVAQI